MPRKCDEVGGSVAFYRVRWVVEENGVGWKRGVQIFVNVGVLAFPEGG